MRLAACKVDVKGAGSECWIVAAVPERGYQPAVFATEKEADELAARLNALSQKPPWRCPVHGELAEADVLLGRGGRWGTHAGCASIVRREPSR